MEENRTNEIISAEFVFSYDKDVTALPLPAEECSARIDEINARLEKYANNADKMDYAIAVGSGILCGALDIYILPTAKTVIPQAQNVIRQNLESNQGYIEMAENSAEILLTGMIRTVNSDVKDLNVIIDFF